MSDEFFCMVLNETNLMFSKKFKRLDIDASVLSVADVLTYINFREMFLSVEFENGKSVVITNAYIDTPFEYLQKKYKEQRAYFFMANSNMACFKIFDNGKISRKVSSYGKIKNGKISMEEQTIGAPCEYEVETNKVYKMKYDTRAIDLCKADIFKMIDFYVGFENLEDSKIKSKKLYVCTESKNLPFAMETFSKPEYLQSLLHVGGSDSVCEYTYPFIVYQAKNTLLYSVFKRRYHLSEVRSAKKLLKINLFNAHKDKLKCDDCRGFDIFSISDFVCSLSTCVQETRCPFDKYQTVATQVLNSFDKPKEYIVQNSHLFYFVNEFKSNKFSITVYCIMKNGKEQKAQNVATLDEFDSSSVNLFYEKIVDYCLNQNISNLLN